MQNDTNYDGINPKPIDPVDPLVAETNQYGEIQPSQQLVVPAVPNQPAAYQPEFVPAPTPTTYFSAPAMSEIPLGTIGSGPTIDAPGAMPPAKKSKKKLIIIGSIVAGALLILSGGSALAYSVWYQNPEKVVTDSLMNALTARTVQSTGSLEVKNSEYEIKVTFDGKTADKNAELAVKVDYTVGSKVFKLDGGGHFSADGDLYVKVNNVDTIISALTGEAAGGSTAFDDISSKVEGRWIKITSEDVGEFSEEYKKTQVCIEDVTKQVTSDKKLGREVVDLYKNNNFILIKESLGSRTINNTGSLGYVIDVDTKKIKTFATGLESTELGKKLKDCDDTIDFKGFADSFDADETGTKENEGVVELWVSRFGHELTEAKANGASDGTDIKVVFTPIFNKDLTIKTPSDAMTVESLQAELEKAAEAYYADYSAELYS